MKNQHCQTIGLVAMLGLVGCEPSAVSKAKAAVAHDMRDPGSVQFRNVVQRDEGTVCGELNAKNAMGAYVGFARFVVSDARGVEIESADEPIPRARWRLWCEPDSIRTPTERDSLRAAVRTVDSMYRAMDSLFKGR